jgi:hypothetical protein
MPIYTIESSKNTYETKYDRSLPSYKRNIKSIINSLKSDGVDLILANQPFLYKETMNFDESSRLFFPKLHCEVDGKIPSVKSMIKSMNTYNDSLETIAEENKVRFIDLESKLPKNLDYFTDDVHYTNKGNVRIADILYEYIKTNALIE